jgi:hypothetical protein
MKIAMAALLVAASVAFPATAHAACGDPDQPRCTGPVPTVDEVTAMMNEVADPNIPAVNKNDIVTPPFDDDQAPKFDNLLNVMRSAGVLPISFTATDIQPAPNNTAGATVETPPTWRMKAGTAPIVLVLQNGRWMITHETAVARVKHLFGDELHWHGSAGLL